MAERLAHVMSPYVRSHADNPVDWWPWGREAFAEARKRDVPVFISIGYATCHWCHVMARETFSDPDVARMLNENVVSIKVDREEHPGVDESYMAQAAAFTQGLGWPLSVFASPGGEAFFAGTYFPPEPIGGRPSFTQVLEAVMDAWRSRRESVQASSDAIGQAVRAAGQRAAERSSVPTVEEITASAGELARHEDTLFGGFGGAPKFPVGPTLSLLQTVGENDLAQRTLTAMAGSPLRDRDGGFFRYATQRDWSEPHYERMLYDNALLLRAYTTAWQSGDDASADIVCGIADFLERTLFLGDGFASGQDSESTIDGVRSEGGYYRAADRSGLEKPPLDDKVLTGWNGLAIEALARAGTVFARPDWVDLARRAAEGILARHDDGEGLKRASVRRDGQLVISSAAATLEDYGMLACALIELSSACGEPAFAVRARELLETVRTDDGYASPQQDHVLEQNGLALAADVNESASPSGLSACARAERMLVELGASGADRTHALAALADAASTGTAAPIGAAGVLEETVRLQRPARQAVIVAPTSTPDAGDASAQGSAAEIPESVRRRRASTFAVVTDEQARALAASGLGLFDGRTSTGEAVLYDCDDGVCSLPVSIR